MSDDPTVLGMIYNKLESIDKKVETVCDMQTELRLSDAEMKARLGAIELMNVATQEEVHQLRDRIDTHQRETALHYNPYYDETLGKKLWRKKPEIAAGGGLGALIASIILLLLQNYNGG